MLTEFRSPYGFFQDEMNSIPFERPRWATWKKEEVRKKRSLLFHFMIWSYLFIASAILAVPMWAATGSEITLGAPLLLGGIALMILGAYKRTAVAI